MSDGSSQAWSDVGERFRKLGADLKQHYEASGRPPAEAVGDSLRAMADQIGRACEALGDAVRDKQLQQDAAQAAQAFADAMAQTFDDVTEQIKERVSPKREDT